MTDEKRAELEQKYLLALLTRDAKIWHSRATRSIHALDDIEEAKPKEKRQRKTFLSEIPCNKCGSHRRFTGSGYKCVQCSTEKAKRVDDFKREAQKLTPPVPRGRGLGIRPSQQLSDRAVARRNYLAKLARAAEANPPTVPTTPTIEANPVAPAAVSARAAAMAAGEKRYIGEPCQCGNRVRYVSHRGCVECHKAANRRHKRAQRAAAITGPAAPVTAEPRRLRPTQIRPPGPGQNAPFKRLMPFPRGARFVAK